MSGLVFRPPVTRSTCSLALPHREQGEEQPPAAYLMFVDGCLSKSCLGGLWCLGHAICIDCGMGVREGRLEYRRYPDEKPEVAAVMSR